ncbi:hypothetical protein Ancab_019735 [Ancistrocladus abbreviatus]
MATKARVLAAFSAMKSIGIHESKTKPVLKSLLKLYDKNWELIEEENYRVLADAIFDYEDKEVMEKNTTSENADQGEVLEEEAQVQDEPERPLKRLRKKGQDVPPYGQASLATGESSLKKPKVEAGAAPENSKQQAWGTTQSPHSDGSGRADSRPVSPPPQLRNKGKQPVSPQMGVRGKFQEPVLSQAAPSAKKTTAERTSQALQIKEYRVEQGTTAASGEKMSGSNALIKPKDEPFTDDMPPYEVPLAVVHPESVNEERPANAGSTQSQHGAQSDASNFVNRISRRVAEIASSGKEPSNLEGENMPLKSPATLEIAASPLGEVKISLNCNFVLGRPNFRVPSLDEVVKHMEDKCLRSYKILDPTFSVKKLMRDFCDSFLELGTASNVRSDGEQINRTSPVVELNNSAPPDFVTDDGIRETAGNGIVTCSFNGSASDNSSDGAAATHVSSPLLSCRPETLTHPNRESVDNGSVEKESMSSVHSNMNSIVIVHQHQPNPDDTRCLHDVNDITRGEERVKVPLLLDSNNELLPSFHYIPRNVVSQNADVNFSLAQIGDEDCCPTCCGDCLSVATRCACTCRNGGDFAYTSDGLVKEEYLEECISMVRDPQKHHLSYCKECPLERCKNEDVLEPCKGHLERKFIKECWSKCGCSKHCVNRVVQRGITCKLQVFMTHEGKGWGLRTLEDLPKGSFVCEYVGEILTITELHRRIFRRRSNDKHSYSVVLDADWGSGVLKDEHALCLDAASYGNVARFINHRCLDANLIEIPVEVDTPNHLYYRVAFFTTRQVGALEELTWDYGIDFDDPDHHFKAFHCLCGSSFCRNMKRSNRSRSASILR